MKKQMIITLMIISLIGIVFAVELITTRNETYSLTNKEDTALRDKNYLSDDLSYLEYSTGGDCYIVINDVGLHGIKEGYDCKTETPNEALERKLKELANVTIERNNRAERTPDAKVDVTRR